VTGFELPAALAASVAADPDPARRRWLDQLPGLVAGLAGQWDVTAGRPFQPGGQVSWVAPARGAGGERLVLKVGWAHPEALHEAAALRFWDGNGAVTVHAEARLADTVALLLERCEPGTQLARLPEPETDDVVCGLLPRLWQPPPPGHQFPALQSMCDAWADRFAEEAAAPGPARLDTGIERAGLELFRSLPGSADREVLLATDLHAHNILAATRQPWLAIDPKPHVGDPAYDPLQHMINCARLRADPAALVRRIAGLLDLDAERLRLWTFARCVQESPGCPDLAAIAAQLAP
jgi:streptomycin 6-kinase